RFIKATCNQPSARAIRAIPSSKRGGRRLWGKRMTDLVRRYRTVFISDIHLGTKGCQAELLLDFIKSIECETLYLVGDIIDGWKLKGGWFWPQSHNDVVQKVLRMARKGTRVVYVPGNHDG